MRTFAWLGLGVVLVLVVAAPACAPEQADPQATRTGAVIANRNLDILFMIDNSSSMRPSQTSLTANIPMFMDGLKALPGGLPNIHVAVVSSDMGAGDGSISGCSMMGDNGVFQSAARAPCTATTLQAGATFISNVGGVANYTAADISTVFTCIAALGDTGCGFEHQFASVLRALGADGQAAPAANQGFLRSDALLAIIMVTNEDDCSSRGPANLYDTTMNMLLTSPLGPTANFRCNEFGHVCDGARPSRNAPNNDVAAQVPLTNCTSSECDGALIPVAEFAARIKALKTAPSSEVLVAALSGPSTPYTVTWKAPSVADTSCGAETCPWPVIAHSCTATDGSFADPSVRINQWVAGFGANGLQFSICDTDYGPALQMIASRIGTLLAAGGGTGGPPGPIPTCAATGSGGQGGGGGGQGGTTGAAGSTGANPGTDGGPDGGKHSGGGGCQIGSAPTSAWAVAAAGAVTALLAFRRRRRRAGSSRRG